MRNVPPVGQNFGIEFTKTFSMKSPNSFHKIKIVVLLTRMTQKNLGPTSFSIVFMRPLTCQIGQNQVFCYTTDIWKVKICNFHRKFILSTLSKYAKFFISFRNKKIFFCRSVPWTLDALGQNFFVELRKTDFRIGILVIFWETFVLRFFKIRAFWYLAL